MRAFSSMTRVVVPVVPWSTARITEEQSESLAGQAYGSIGRRAPKGRRKGGRVVLSDRALREAIASGRLHVTPLDETAIQPSSIDLRLGARFQVFVNQTETHIDPRLNQPDLTKTVEVDDGASFVLHPGEFVLGGTVETIQMPDDLVGRIEGKSSLGRLGLMVHSTAGYVDPGFRGSLTLELSNHANLPILLWPGMRVSQLVGHAAHEPGGAPVRLAGTGQQVSGPVGVDPQPVAPWIRLAALPAWFRSTQWQKPPISPQQPPAARSLSSNRQVA